MRTLSETLGTASDRSWRDHVPVTHRIAWLDVFAECALEGNQLAVVDAADDIETQTMQGVAKEMNLSETTFVQSPGAETADYRNRIFTVGAELPFAGHPSLGTAVAVARWRGVEQASFTQETGAGLQGVEVQRDGEAWRASMLQNKAEFGGDHDPAETMRSVGLDASDAAGELTAQVVSTGLPTLIAPVASAQAVWRARPDFAAIAELLAAEPLRIDETPSFYLVHCDPESRTARARMFSEEVPGGEDPATGSAAGPLCCYLAQRGWERVTISQGEEMGRPSLIEVEMEDGHPRVSGNVVAVMDGEIELP